MNEVEIPVQICREGVTLPTYAKQGDAGMDICAAEDAMIYPGDTAIIPTGLKVAIPEGYELQIRPRSGISCKTPLRVSNSPGTLDSGYRDEVGVIITNTSNDGQQIFTIDTKGNNKGIYQINKGDRIAQIVLQEVPKIKFNIVQDVSSIGVNRGGGFGSTGILSDNSIKKDTRETTFKSEKERLTTLNNNFNHDNMIKKKS